MSIKVLRDARSHPARDMAIRSIECVEKGDREGWLTEHMFILGVNGPGGRVSYFSGAFPSLCGKTSTSMVEGERIIGDDIAYLRKRDNKVYGVNVEKGIFWSEAI